LDTTWEATFFPTSRQLESQILVHSMGQADSFVAKVAPYGEIPITAMWNLTAIASVA
jgi:hypothetical protein